MEAIIYKRYSSREQKRGSSLTRQSSVCEAYCERKGWRVAKVVSDEGVSAWNGANIETGNLAKLTKSLLQDGENKVIVVEQLDRITRQPPNKVINWLTTLTDSGSALATANDDVVITANSFAENPMNTMGLVFNAYRAFSESQHKSNRLRAAWNQKRKSGKPMTGRTVAWLKLIDGEFKVIEERAEVVRRIFQLALQGKGPTLIARALNEDGIETFGKSNGWHVSYIKKILRNRAVLGEFQPHIKKKGGERKPAGDLMPDYYPQVVSERDFSLVQAQRPTVRQAASRGYANLLSGLCKCTACGGNVVYLNGGIETRAGGSQVRREYLQCEQSRRGLCDLRQRYPYTVIRDMVLDKILEVGLKATAEPNDRLKQIEEEVLALERQAKDAETRAQRLLILFEEGDDAAGARYRANRAEATAKNGAASLARSKLAAEQATPTLGVQAERVSALRSQLECSEDARHEAKIAIDHFVRKIVCGPEREQFDLDVSADILLQFDHGMSKFWRDAAEAAQAART